MLPQYSNYATSSFLLYLDNRISNNSTIYNVGTQAYPINQIFNGYNTYAFPFGQIVSDISVSGINNLTGIYLNNSFIPLGQSGLSGINFDKSQIYIDPNYAPQINAISGNYTVKEINVTLADFPDITLLFETKLGLRNKYIHTNVSGLLNNIMTYPTIFVENASAPTNKPWQMGGVDQSRTVFNLYLFAETLYQKNAMMSLLADMAWKYVPLIDNISAFPMNNLGSYKNNIPYNYNTLTQNLISSGKAMLIEDVTITEFGKRGITQEIELLTTEAFFSLITVTAWTARVAS